MVSTILEGARTHNLQGVSVALEPGQIVAVTGVSGAGKSSLALDTLYAEGQRRFVEGFSPYARQFLERLERPPMTRLEPVPAGIAVDRRAPVKSSRSTVATMADIEPYLAALFLREATPVCPEHELPGVDLTVELAAQRIDVWAGSERVVVSYGVAVKGREDYLEVREQLAREGYRRLLIAGEAQDIDALKPSVAAKQGSLSVVIDRFGGSRELARVAAAVETAWQRGSGVLHAHVAETRLVLRRGLSCPECSRALEAARSGLFSYESPVGACPACRGFGRTLGVDLNKVIPDPSRSIDDGVVRPWRGNSTKWERAEVKKLCKRHGIPSDRPFSSLTAAQQKLILEGDGSWHKGLFPGVLGWFKWLETKTYKMHVRVLLARYRSYDECAACGGRRLNPTALSYRVGGLSIADYHALEIGEARRLVDALKTQTAQGDLARRELSTRLGYLDRVGLGYLTLDRQARTLSGGEAQRVTLTAALGTSLHNALFVLDEPSVGLHPSDVAPLGEMIRELGERNNTVLVVEHDPALISAADRVLELGPGAGPSGGKIVFDGSPAEARMAGGATARALSGVARRSEPVRVPSGWLELRGATANNLRGIDVKVPLGVICAVTGPSGSGKSTLCEDILYRALARHFGDFDEELPGAHTSLTGQQQLERVALVDQSPLGRTSRGNPATYTKAWDAIRTLYGKEPTAAARGLTASHFSFNVAGGRCEACSGEGFETVEMQFLADVRLVCPVCQGLRFKPEVLSIQRAGVSIADVLEMTVERALGTFQSEAAIQRALGPLQLLGLGYLRIGQPLTTLSGGEAQRLKLARTLTEELRGALLILDEPSAGLHADEVEKVLGALSAIVTAGGSVLVVEHDLDVIGSADYVLDLGPGAGARGGLLLDQGPPRGLSNPDSKTAAALHTYFAGSATPKKGTGKKSIERRAAPRNASHTLSVVRAREHNLKDVSIEIPHGKLSVVTGPSGSGKSSLAFDVVFAEGQRRFLETLTPYARQFLPTMPRPDVDRVSGVPPSIALEQRTTRAGGKSTVATVTEVAHYLRLLFAKLAILYCPDHDQPIAHTTPEVVLANLKRAGSGNALLAPVVQARKGTYLDVFTAAEKAGIAHAYADGVLVKTSEPPRLAKTKEHTIDLVVVPQVDPKKLAREDLERALRLGAGAVKLRAPSGKEQLFSLQSACPNCGFSAPELDPRWFSFATKQGRCETCDGAGVLITEPVKKRGRKAAETVAAPPVPCPTCHGARLSPIPRAARFDGEHFHELTARSVTSLLTRLEALRISGDAAQIAQPILTELLRRVRFLNQVGLGYLSLDRSATTLSGGEMQRLRLAAQLGAGLTGALYVLDEPTIGLHPRDTGRLIDNLRSLVDLGSTVLVVEHDSETIQAADFLIDLGPGGGSRGGRIVAAGAPAAVCAEPDSPTGRALSAPPELRSALAIPAKHEMLRLSGASAHNLKGVDIEIPLGRFTVVGGVSGSGKSTLVRQVLLPALRERLQLVTEPPGAFESLSEGNGLKRAVSVDQSPIGRTPRSVPATFLGIWDQIRRIFAATPDAKVRGFEPARFSFNTGRGGQCPTCEGQGAITHEMSFLPDVVSTCPTCDGLRFEPRTLEVRYMERSIGDVLKLTAEEAVRVFENHPSVAAPLRILCDLGAGYIALGQGSHTLSGGEAQRLKLAAELTQKATPGGTLYVLDEPTTGLHMADVTRLMGVLSQLVDRGDTLVVIEHHPEVLAGADYLIELGPEAGERGGKVVAAAAPRAVAKLKTATAQVLKQVFQAERGRSTLAG
ncbi:MAG TPA: excinuclease ABC subunit UvrA [Polyangiaceae bacterium]|nr:excinuclease ABC subunit UvrA [Polyangiaceae bacterium]